MTKEEILALAGKHWHRDSFNIEYFDAEAFYHAARKPLEEEIERLKVVNAFEAGLDKGAETVDKPLIHAATE